MIVVWDILISFGFVMTRSFAYKFQGENYPPLPTSYHVVRGWPWHLSPNPMPGFGSLTSPRSAWTVYPWTLLPYYHRLSSSTQSIRVPSTGYFTSWRSFTVYLTIVIMSWYVLSCLDSLAHTRKVRIQEGGQSRRHDGYDEDRSCGEDDWSRLRNWRKTIQDYGKRGKPVAERGQGISGFPKR